MSNPNTPPPPTQETQQSDPPPPPAAVEGVGDGGGGGSRSGGGGGGDSRGKSPEKDKDVDLGGAPSSSSATSKTRGKKKADGAGDGADQRRKRPKKAQDGASSSSATSTKKQRGRPEGAPDISPPCGVCNKRFWSLKALYGHMRTHKDRGWGGIAPPSSLSEAQPVQPAKPPKEDEIAASLILLASGLQTALQESGESGRFECGSCNKVFKSHQALGGHRASHKNAKGCFAKAREEGGGGEENGAVEEGQDLEADMKPNLENNEKEEEEGVGPSSVRRGCLVDLNLPAPTEEEEESSSTSSSSSSSEIDLNR